MVFEPILRLWYLINHYEFTSLFTIILLEESGVPLPAPGDVFIMNAGWRASRGHGDFWHVALVVIIATIIGSSLLYFVARFLGEKVLFKYFHFLHINRTKLKTVEGWIQTHESRVLILGRLTPGFRILTTLASGFFGIPYHVFILNTTLATMIWVSFYFFLGRYLGFHSLLIFKFLFRQHPYITYPFIIILIFLLVRYLYKRVFLKLNGKRED